MWNSGVIYIDLQVFQTVLVTLLVCILLTSLINTNTTWVEYDSCKRFFVYSQIYAMKN